MQASTMFFIINIFFSLHDLSSITLTLFVIEVTRTANMLFFMKTNIKKKLAIYSQTHNSGLKSNLNFKAITFRIPLLIAISVNFKLSFDFIS